MSDEMEPVLFVDSHNCRQGVCRRGRVHHERLIHRASFVVVRSVAGHVCVQQRSAFKDLYPSEWDLAAGGMMRPDETVAANLSRELHEELGLYRVFQRWHWFYFENSSQRVWGALALVTATPEDVRLSDEVSAIQWLAPKEALRLPNITPDTRHALSILEQISRDIPLNDD